MFNSMPWDEGRDTGDDELADELAEMEAEEQEWLAWVDALARGESDFAVPVGPRPGLAKAHCRHGAYEFVLDGQTRHAVCCTCGHTWLIALGAGDTDYLPADLPRVAHR